MTTVYSGGTFDLFHVGHVELLAACRKLAGPDGRVVIGLNTDDFVMRYKDRHTINTLDERMRLVGACRYVDEVVVNEGDEDSKHIIDKVCPDVVAIGVDWATKDYYSQMGFTPTWLAERGITLIYIAHAASHSVSSTNIRVRLESGQW